MHCTSKQTLWMRNDAEKRHGVQNRWHHGSPWDPVISGTLVRLAPAAQLPLSAEVSLRTIRSRWKHWHLASPHAPPAACEWLSDCELHFRISSTALPRGSTSLAPITLMQSSSPFLPLCLGPICLCKQGVSFCNPGFENLH